MSDKNLLKNRRSTNSTKGGKEVEGRKKKWGWGRVSIIIIAVLHAR